MKGRGLEIILHTNGLLINKIIAKQIAPLVSRISLTMDAVDPKVQLLIRKSSSITDHTIKLVKISKSLGLESNIKTLVTKVNIDEIDKVGSIVSKLPIAYWSLLGFIPIGRGKENAQQSNVTKKDFNNIYKKMNDKYQSVKIKKREYSGNQYCFITPNGDVYTNKNMKDIRIGNIFRRSLKNLMRNLNLGK